VRIILYITLFTLLGCENFPLLSSTNSKVGEMSRDDVDTTQATLNVSNKIKDDTGLTFNDLTGQGISSFIDKQLSPEVDCLNISDDSRPSPRASQEMLTESSGNEDFSGKRKELFNNFTKLGGDPVAFKQALCFFDENKDNKFQKKTKGKFKGTTQIKNKKFMVIQDFNQPSSKKRLLLLNLETNEVQAFYSAHGVGTPDRPWNPRNDSLTVKNFSNKKGSNLTPRGFFITGERSPSSKAWKWHMKLDGVQRDINDNARDRAIVFHQGVRSKDWNERLVWPGRTSSNEDSPELYEKYESGRDRVYKAQNMTWGCTAVAREYAEEIYDKTKGGAVYYNYSPKEKELGAQYCGNNLLKK